MRERLRIGCGGAFWGDTETGPERVVTSGEIDVLVIDYLAEITMALLGRVRAKSPAYGYVTDFVEQMGALGPEIARRNIRVVVNAGGVNPEACGEAVKTALAARNVDLRVAVVSGDDVTSQVANLRAGGLRDMFNGAELPAKPWSANAYLGALPIAQALAAGADIVITGRVVDSALVLGPLIEAFGWKSTDYDLLSAGSLAGHIIECGAQTTGGIATDWQNVPGWEDMGWPIVDCAPDGTFTVGKTSGSGGLVAPQTVAEQIVYEVGDPANYVLPDVVCDFSRVSLKAVGENRVHVSGARGRAPTGKYKITVTAPDGFKATGLLMIGGRDAVAKARRTAQALETRCSALLSTRSLAPFLRVSTEVLGAEDTYGLHASQAAQATREVVLKLAVHHRDKVGADIFSREFVSCATAMAQGTTGFAGGRPRVSPVIRIYSCLVDASSVTPLVLMDGTSKPCPFVDGEKDARHPEPKAAAGSKAAVAMPEGPRVTVPLIAIAYGRSGDKGDDANIGVLARRPEFVPAIAAGVTAKVVAAYFAHVLGGDVDRFEWPGLDGFNFVLHAALDGGGIASLRHDPQGKALAQMLLDLPVEIPAAWISAGLVPEDMLIPLRA